MKEKLEFTNREGIADNNEDLRRELLDFMREKAYRPLTAEELMEHFQPADGEEFMRLLAEMEEEGKIVRTRRGRYGVPEKMNLVVGRLVMNPRGYAFLLPDRPEEEDIFIGAGNLNGAMHNDRVIVRPLGPAVGGRSREGEVIRILQRANRRVVGTFEKGNRRYGYVVPDDKRLVYDIFVPVGAQNRARDGAKVVVEITRWPEQRRNPEGRIVEVIGYGNEPGLDVEVLIRKYDLPVDFPPEVYRELESIPDYVLPEEMEGRRDLRHLDMVTIDGEDAKDLDDAVSLEVLPDGLYRLGVHIADVGHYVKEGSALDREAYRRGTSVYLVDRVIPMLPPKLSNGICSLNPQVDRLALSVIMDIDSKGVVRRHEIFESVIRTRERMTYTAVKKILVDRDEELRARYRPLVPMFEAMAELCQILRARRMRRGSIDFNFPETKVKLDERGKPVEIVRYERSIADMIIEEFMLAANETVARHYYWMEVPFLYRIHEEPDEEKIEALREFLYNLGYLLKGRGSVHPRALQKVVEEAAGTPAEKVVHTMVLRSLKQACYAEQWLGHYGLAAEYYTHFTSPIRRYPDLVIHRIIKEILHKGQLSPARREALAARMPDIARQASERERIAMEAERESVDMKIVQYMAERVGDVFDGVISSVTSFGFFVELENSAEGLVHVTTLHDDFYEFNEKQLTLTGRHRKRVFRIGMPVRVRLVRANVEERQLDFELVEEE